MKMATLAPVPNSRKSAVNGSKTDRSGNGNCLHHRPMPQTFDRQPNLAHRALHRFLLDMVALVYEVDHCQLVARTRGRKNIAFTRQVAMYLAHTAGGLSLSDVGRLFGRDRTTVAHGCALVEDGRDDLTFDRSLSHLESASSCQMDLFRTISQSHAPTIGARKGSQVGPKA